MKSISSTTIPRFDKVYFIHVPKTGGKSILAALGGDLVRAHNTRHRVWRDRRNLAAWRACGGLPVCAVVRDPYDRAESLYYFFRQFKWPEHFGAHKRIQSIARQCGGLSEFWETLDIPAAAAAARHFKNQSEFLPGWPIDHLIRFEKLEQGFDEMAAMLGRQDAVLPHKNASVRSGETMSDHAAARIRDFYRADFDRYYPDL